VVMVGVGVPVDLMVNDNVVFRLRSCGDCYIGVDGACGVDVDIDERSLNAYGDSRTS